MFTGGRPLYRSSAVGDIFYHNDGLDSTMLVTDSSGNILNSYKYDAFGDLRSANETVSNNIRFTGEFQDANDLIYLRARYYDPGDGRFLSQDSFLGDYNDPGTLNRYAYADNNPVLYVDPSGHVSVCMAGAGTINMPWTDFSDFKSDWAGRAILWHYLYGNGKWILIMIRVGINIWRIINY